MKMCQNLKDFYHSIEIIISKWTMCVLQNYHKTAIQSIIQLVLRIFAHNFMKDIDL